MRVYIPAARRAALMLFRRGSEADYRRADALTAQRQQIAAEIFTGIMSGRISEAHQRTGKTLTIYTRSIRGEHVQETHCTLDRDGDWTPTGHGDRYNPRQIDLAAGYYITITEEATA